MTVADWYELLAVFVSSTGVVGAAFSAVLACMLRRARKDAEQKRKERISMELSRLEGEECLSGVVMALVHVCGKDDPELKQALRAYSAYLDRRRTFRNEIISSYTVK